MNSNDTPVAVSGEDEAKSSIPLFTISSSPSYLNVCAHCGQCLDQFVSAPDKLNVVLFYKDDDGTIKEWHPKAQKEGLQQ